MGLTYFKALLTTAALLLALVQTVTMLQVRGTIKLARLPVRTLVRIHRWVGIALTILVLLVALLCLYAVFGLGYHLEFSRVQAHVPLGAAAAIVLAAKVLVSNRYRRYLRHSMALGLWALGLLAGTFVFSALWLYLGLA